MAVAACSRNAPATLGAHTRSMPSRVRAATIPSPVTPAACTTPRNGRPVSSAAATSRSATPAEAISPATKSDLGAICKVGEFPSLIVRRIGSTVEDEPPRAAFGKPPRDDHAQAAQAAGDDVRTIRADNGFAGLMLVCIEGRTREPFNISTLRPAGRSHRLSPATPVHSSTPRRGSPGRPLRPDRREWRRHPVRRPEHEPLRRGTASCG